MKFQIINKSTRLDAEAAKLNLTGNAVCNLIAQAVQLQMNDDVCPAWDVNAVVLGPTDSSEGIDCVVAVMDTPDEDGVLGWHTEYDDVIFSHIFVSPILDNGGDLMSNLALSLSAVISHEIMEASIDPHIGDWSQRADGILFAREIGDPVEADAYTKTVQGHEIVVSNFVLPCWFDAECKTGKFDFLGKLSAPFTLSTGGYAVTMQPGPTSEIGARSAARQAAKGKNSRRQRRLDGRKRN